MIRLSGVREMEAKLRSAVNSPDVRQAMRIRFLVKSDPELVAKIEEFRRRLSSTAGVENGKVLGEWMKWIRQRAARGGTGLFELKETEL